MTTVYSIFKYSKNRFSVVFFKFLVRFTKCLGMCLPEKVLDIHVMNEWLFQQTQSTVAFNFKQTLYNNTIYFN